MVVGARMNLFGAELPRLARQDARLIYYPISFPTGHMCPDGIHPSESGYAEWGRQFAEACARSDV
jgi:lysophospholipase L1-like esterase